MYTCIYKYLYTIQREIERERERGRGEGGRKGRIYSALISMVAENPAQGPIPRLRLMYGNEPKSGCGVSNEHTEEEEDEVAPPCARLCGGVGWLGIAPIFPSPG